VHQTLYDEEGRVHSFRKNTKSASSDDGGIAEANSLYATDAELFGTCAPFLRANKLRDAKRRNYVIQPGGACIYFKDDAPLKDPYGGGRVQFTAPDERESFGHNTQPDSAIQHPSILFDVGGSGLPRGQGK
jgi:hypothetical protein